MRRRIVALCQEHPEGFTPTESRTLLRVNKILADTCLGMRRYGLVQRVGHGRYVAAAPAQHDHPEGDISCGFLWAIWTGRPRTQSCARCLSPMVRSGPS